MIITCETPETPSRRGRTTQSASERNSIGDVLVLVIEMSMISPIVEEMGPSTGGGTPAGIRTCCNFSVTSWRARKKSVKKSNSTKTMEMPKEEIERKRK